MNQKTVVGLENKFDSDASANSHVNRYEIANQQGTSQDTDCGSTHEFNNENESLDYEQIIIDIHEEEPEVSCAQDKTKTWSNYTPSMLKRPVHEKLKTPTTSASTSIQQPVAAASGSWTTRRRPISNNLSSSIITQQYSDLSKTKLEIANIELAALKSSVLQKQEREGIERTLTQKLELDI